MRRLLARNFVKLAGLGLHHDTRAAIVEYSCGALMDLNVRPSAAEFDARHKSGKRTAGNCHPHPLAHVQSPSKPQADPERAAIASRKAPASAASGMVGLSWKGFHSTSIGGFPSRAMARSKRPFTHITPRTYGVRDDLDLQLLSTWHTQIF